MSAPTASDRVKAATPGPDGAGDSIEEASPTSSKADVQTKGGEGAGDTAVETASSSNAGAAIMANIHESGAAEEGTSGSGDDMTAAAATAASASLGDVLEEAASSQDQLLTSNSKGASGESTSEKPGANQSGLKTFSSDMQVQMNFGWVPMLMGLMPDAESPNNFEAQIGAKVNHGVKQAPTMVDIINNMIGDKAGFGGRPRASMGNDLPMCRVLGMEIADDESKKKCTVQLVASVSDDTNKEWNDYVGRYFYKKTDDGKNPLKERLHQRADAYKVDPFNENNHDQILAMYPGANEHYNKAKEAASRKAKENDRQLDALDKYRALVWAISTWKFHALWDGGDDNGKDEIIELINIKEGNHRAGAGLIMLFNAAYKPSNGKIECDTLDKDWFVQQLVAYDVKKRKSEDIAAAYSNVNIRDEVLQLVQDPESSLRKDNMTVVLFFGKTEDVFLEHDVDMGYIQSLDILFSRTVANDKQGSVEPTENTTIARNLKAILDLMDRNEDNLPEGEVVNFSANASENGELYVGYERDAKKGKTPPRCKLFASEQWREFVRHPCPDTINDYCRSIDMGSVILKQPLTFPGKQSKPNSKLVPQPSGNVYHPPFPLDQANMFTLLGQEGPGSKKDNAGPAKGETYAARRIEEGKSSHPITTSEFLRAMVVAATAPSAMRATSNTRRYAWSRFPQRRLCEHAVQHIVDSENFEVFANKWGNKLVGKSWEDVEWRKDFGDGQIIKHANVYIAFSCMIADLVVACFGNYKSDGMKRARALVDMLATAHDDAKGYSDNAMVTNLGMLYIRLRHYAELVTERIKADANLRCQNVAKVNAGFLYWNVLNGIMKSLAKVFTIYGVDPVPSLEDPVRQYLSQFVDMYEAMEAREGSLTPPSEEEKMLYRRLVEHAKLELNTYSKPSGGIAQQKIVNIVATSMRVAGLEDPERNLGNNQHTLRPNMGVWGLFATFFIANTCNRHITYQHDRGSERKQALLMKRQYMAPTSGSNPSRNVAISFQGNEASKSWSVDGFEMPDGIHLGEPVSWQEWAKFVFGGNVRQSYPEQERQNRIDEAVGLRASIVMMNNQKTTKFTADLPECTIETTVAKQSSPTKRTDAKQEALDNAQNHLGILMRMYREGRKIESHEIKAYAFDEFMDYMRHNSASILSGREYTSSAMLSPKKKKKMNEKEIMRHFREYDASSQRQLRRFQEVRRKNMDGAMETDGDEDSDLDVNDANGGGELSDADYEESKTEPEPTWSVQSVVAYLQGKWKRGQVTAQDEGFKVIGARVGRKIESWFKGETDDKHFHQDEDRATMRQIASIWRLDKVERTQYRLTAASEQKVPPPTNAKPDEKAAHESDGSEMEDKKRKAADGEPNNHMVTPAKKAKTQKAAGTGNDTEMTEVTSVVKSLSPARNKERNKNIPDAVPRKKFTDLTSMTITKLKVGSSFQTGNWNLLRSEDVEAARGVIKTKKTHREDVLFVILDHSGSAKEIRSMWAEYFLNDDPAFQKLGKRDAINDLIDYIVGGDQSKSSGGGANEA